MTFVTIAFRGKGFYPDWPHGGFLAKIPTMATEYPHDSLEQVQATPDAIEALWTSYWAPLLKEGGAGSVKAELFEYYHLVNAARLVYRHVTGGVTDDLCASGEGIIAMADARIGELTEALRHRIEVLEGRPSPPEAPEG